jgi:hypothetical protein
MTQDDSDFKVADRRIFTEDGTVRKDRVADPKLEAALEKDFASVASPRLGAETAPPMTFQTLILSLSTTAMLQMGLLAAQDQNQPEKDMEGAKQTIDILQILKEKTAGNLGEEESQLLEASLFDLKMWYLKATDNVRL